VLASTLAGAGIGAATGGIIGALVGLGVPEEDAQHFNRGLESGAVLVTVDAGDRIPEALEILERHDVDLGPSRGERFRDADAAAAAGVSTGSADRAGDLDEQRRMQLREEQLLVDKERVQAGEVLIRKEAVIERRSAADVDASGEPIGERRRREQTSYRGPERREAVL
jgi:hypothetical protein